MIPLRIEATNFGAIPYANIDLTSITLSAVCAPNGTGKSTAFTIAPIFALFGATKNGCGVDDMVRAGTQETAVTFEFEHQAEVYRVTRTRSTKGKGKSTLELQHWAGGKWISMSGATIRETEEKIRALLNLDADTFTASSMILQGKANEFTAKPPGQRKDVLKKVLGLDIYDSLLERARAKERAASVELEAAKIKLAELDEKLKDKDRVEAGYMDVEAELAAVSADIKARETELKEAEELVRQLEVKAEKVRELRERITVITGEIEGLETQKTGFEDRLEKAVKVISREAEILKKAAEYEEVKQQVTVLQTKRPRLNELSGEINRTEQELSRADGQIKRLTPQIREIEQLLENREALEKASMDYREAVNSLEDMDGKADKWAGVDLKVRDKKEEHQAALSALNIKTEALRNERKTLTAKTAMLGDSKCIDMERATCVFLADAKESREKLKVLTANEEQLKTEAAAVDITYQGIMELEAERDTLGYDPKEHRRLREQVAELRPKAEQAAQLKANTELLKNLLEQKRQTEETKTTVAERLKSVREQARQLSKELEPLRALEESLPNLEKWVKAKEQLPAAMQAAETARERIAELDREIQRKTDDKTNLHIEMQGLELDMADLPVKREAVKALRIQVKALQESQNTLYKRQGGLKAQVDSLAKDEERRLKIVSGMEPKAREVTRWQTLIKAFSRDGIPALIIENAVPELERIANEILGQMTKGDNYLRFETQRDLKSKKDAVAETLDIIVGDWAGERPYETFSGGEQLRIDFAIRFALAELLARRAGSRVEWLTVDEGLGSQDAEHRGLVLEAIKSVADRFKKTIVITHIEEAKSYFDQLIYLEPRDGAVEVKVA